MITLSAEQKQHAFQQLRSIKEQFAARHWFPGTSGNLSVRVGDITDGQFQFAITASGKDKSVHTPEDYLLVDENGVPTDATSLKPSAETLIHCEIYRLTGCGAIFHVHTVFNNIVSEVYGDQGFVPVKAVELIKAFNIWEENARIEIPIVPNYAHIPSIVPEVTKSLNPSIPGIVLRNHGIYAWGANSFEAKRHLEAFEFLFEYVYRMDLLRR
ncbi:methylthioribulose 1-phosphate dehydratase [Paenibacillus sp. SC116]|uniref:methylthioribulose 1-phosphate dehydratase n=1 Tax=Paenibacillus sp. SC116 TaxID=2968986 RepID=UPI00215AB469|nr:methylthioribulose 1-phosphate dehydratase [Paenibacillus sp. SC116]MCR8842911.1 methylthioribulose 1-phosphate dehydratase [Paenibacillus sp. SC116]